LVSLLGFGLALHPVFEFITIETNGPPCAMMRDILSGDLFVEE